MLLLLALAFLLAHDTWLFPLIEGRVGLTTGNRFPLGEVGPSTSRVARCSVDGAEAQVDGGDKISLIEAGSDAKAVAVLLKPHPITLTSASFTKYLEAQNVHLKIPDRDIREHYTKCAKLRLKNSLTNNSVGHPLEFVAMGPSTFQLRLWGKRLTNYLVDVYSEFGDRQLMQTDSAGDVVLHSGDGLHMLRAHWIQRCDSPEFDFESLWCTLVFRVEAL